MIKSKNKATKNVSHSINSVMIGEIKHSPLSSQFYVPTECVRAIGLKSGSSAYFVKDSNAIVITAKHPEDKNGDKRTVYHSKVDLRGNIRISKSFLNKGNNSQLVFATSNMIQVVPADALKN